MKLHDVSNVNNILQKCASNGKIVQEYGENIPGTTNSSIPVNTPPTTTSQLTIFEAPINTTDNFGAKIRGYICPPSSGEYTLWLTGDENSEL